MNIGKKAILHMIQKEEMKQIRDKLTIYLKIKEVGDLNAEE